MKQKIIAMQRDIYFLGLGAKKKRKMAVYVSLLTSDSFKTRPKQNIMGAACSGLGFKNQIFTEKRAPQNG